MSDLPRRRAPMVVAWLLGIALASGVTAAPAAAARPALPSSGQVAPSPGARPMTDWWW